MYRPEVSCIASVRLAPTSTNLCICACVLGCDLHDIVLSVYLHVCMYKYMYVCTLLIDLVLHYLKNSCSYVIVKARKVVLYV